VKIKDSSRKEILEEVGRLSEEERLIMNEKMEVIDEIDVGKEGKFKLVRWSFEVIVREEDIVD